MATCAPTARARALTFLNVVQSSEAQPAKVRTLHTTGGAGVTSARWAAAAGADRIAVAAADDRVCPRTRSMPSNRVAVARGDAGSARRCTSRYSAESTADALAANVTHPPSDAGSIDVYSPIARVS